MPKGYPIEGGWPLVLKDFGVEPAAVLRRAELPADLFSRSETVLSVPDYFRLWSAVEAEIDDPLFSLKLGQNVPVEAFQPPIFAAMCSPNFSVGARRLSHYKRLVAPMAIHIEEDDDAFRMRLQWLNGVQPPDSLASTELVFFVQLFRLATRERIVPLRLEAVRPPSSPEFDAFFGCPVEASKCVALTFSAQDVKRPFLTANEAMWDTFEPSLQRRLGALDQTATTGERVRAALLEALPSGESSIDEISRRLAISKRTLQRRLKDEGTTFQAILTSTREHLAMHYLRRTKLSGAEISYLLGYEDPNSFFRAFHEWTGTTTERARLQA